MHYALCFLCSLLAIARIATAQCQWSPGPGFPSMNGNVNAILRLPDGNVVVGGDFTAAGNVAAKSIVRWNGVSWFPLGAGLGYGPVNHLALLPNGDLIAGGWFDSSGSTPLSRIARWNGSTWSPLGSGLPGTVNAIRVLPNGELIAAGNFASSNSFPVARWDGAAWSALGAGNDPYANCDHSTVVPVLTANDFQCFLNAFAAGCP